MANVSRPNGFRPIRHLNGSPFNGQGVRVCYLAADNTAAAVGDLVDITGAADAEGVPVVTRLTAASGPVYGAIIGFEPDPTNLGNSGWKPASTLRYAYVALANDTVFEAQYNGTFTWAATPGLNADVTLSSATANGGAGLSNMQIDGATAAVGATLAFRILGAVRRPDNDPTDTASVKVEVVCNDSRIGNQIAGV